MRRDFVRGLGLIGLAGATACGAATDVTAVKNRMLSEADPKFTCVDNSAPMRLAPDLRATLPVWGPRQPDDAFVAISNSAPGGFAGLFYENDHFVVTFVDPATADQSRGAIERAFAAQGYSPYGFDMAKAEFRGARWTFAELDEWLRYLPLSKVAGPGTGVSSIDLDEMANTVSFGVIDEESRTKLESQLNALNVPCNLMTTKIQAYAQAL